MKSQLTGDLKNLKASEKLLLEKLGAKRSREDEFINLELARAAAVLSNKLNAQIGLLIGRDGRVTHVIVGSKDRLYIPHLGRYRLDSVRLRCLRLAVFIPQGSRILSKHGESGFKEFLTPDIPADLLTDLEKLRLDALLVIAVLDKAGPGPVTMAYIEPVTKKSTPFIQANVTRDIAFIHARNLPSLVLDFDSFIQELETSIAASTTKSYLTARDRALLIGAYTASARQANSSMAELEELARTAGIEVLDKVIQRRRKLDPKTVIGKGKIEEIVLHSLDLGADLLIFDRELSPGQLRSITNITEIRVIDRSMLILDIFAQRAVSSEGRLQVELAQLKYSLPRLTETDTGLSRLTGGIGGRGPGETKLEIGRRRARDRIADLERRIDKVARQRGVRRERRKQRGVPVVAIVGYTNAGKSTLLNSLTKGDVFVESKLFATLDPSSRRMRFPNDQEVVFVDTVGFIRELPKELVAAFRATLEEVSEADLLLHLVDASNPEMKQQIETVEDTLRLLGFSHKPHILVFNKADKLSGIQMKALTHTFNALSVSALTRKGFSELVVAIQDELTQSFKGVDPGNFLHADIN
jgi:GTPase